MKYFAILLLVNCPFFLFCQKPTLKIYPVDDCSEIRERYNSLFNNSEYFFRIDYDNGKEEIDVDTNFIKIIDNVLSISARTGKTFVRLVNRESGLTTDSFPLSLEGRPKIALWTDVSHLDAEGIVYVRPTNEEGDDLGNKFKLAYMTVHYYDNQNNYLFSVPLESRELHFKVSKDQIVGGRKFKIESLFISKENGLCVNLPDKVIEIRNDH